MATPRSRGKLRLTRERALGILLALLCLLIAVGGSTALADEANAPAQDAASFVPGWTSQDELAEPGGTPIAGPDTDPKAAEMLPHNDLGRDEASDLLTAVFGEVLNEAAGIFDELEVEEFHSDYVAVIGADVSDSAPPAGGQAGLLTSLLPLRAENSDGVKTAVDLDLQYAEGGLQPENPLVDVKIPGEIDQGISLPESGVTIDLAHAPAQRTPSTVADSGAFYPNVAPDSDLTVLPTATGFETSTILRTPDAPLMQTFDLTIPSGAHLESSKEGGASVIKDGRPLVTILPPSGIDAAGDPVSVALEVSGNSIQILASPKPNIAYPVLVDPIFESYYWDQYPNDHSPEWILASSGYPFSTGWGAYTGGIELYSVDGYTTPGSQAMANYYVPRFFTDYNDPVVHERPTSYVKHMTMTHTNFIVYSNPQYAEPVMQLGIWSANKGQWVSYGRMYSTEAPNLYPGYIFDYINPDEVTDAKNAGISLSTSDTMSHWRAFVIGQATVEISDKDYPAFGSAGSAPAWVNGQANSPIPYKVTDPGLGIYQIQSQQPLASGASTTLSAAVGCAGSARNPCPRTIQNSQVPVPYTPSTMPQGENWLKLTATDPISHQSVVSDSRVRVDHTKPVLGQLSGTLSEQAKLGTSASQYTLKYSASDGDSAAPAAAAPFGTAGIGDGKLQRPVGVALDASGNTFVVDRECKCVQKYDPTGKFLSQFGAPGTGNGQFSDPRGMAISAAGNILVADLANKNVQIFNANGGFIRKITYGEFVEPYAVVAAPNERIWVSDVGSHKVFKFREADGVWIGVAYGSSANPAGAATGLVSPVGIAADAAGTIWVTDNNLNRVTIFDYTGKYVNQFGSGGTGPGQLKGPVGIAVAPSGNILVADVLNNRVEEFRLGGEFIRQFATPGSASNQLSEPRGITFGPGNTAYIADAGNKRVAKWSHADYDPQSGVAKIEVKIDNGTPKVLYSQACASQNCSKSDEWVYNANEYPTGQHSVQIISTDGVGLVFEKGLLINSIKDTTPPQIIANSTLFTAPDGWLEQKTYSYSAAATDAGGRGVTSLVLKVDASTVASSSVACPNGGCERTLSGKLDMASYDGGAHPAELIATDGAGLVTRKAWVINVDPKGEITVQEAEDTLEAAEVTSPINPIGPAQQEDQYEGTIAGLTVSDVGSKAVVRNTAVPTTVSEQPQAGLTLMAPRQSDYGMPCGQSDGSEFKAEAEADGEKLDTSTGPAEGPCVHASPIPGAESRIPISIQPVTTASGATEASVSGGAATVAANTASHVDTIVRPIYDGAMIFNVLRDGAAPEAFSWKVELEPDQELKLLDDQHAAVYYSDGFHVAVGISAEPAHDAVGTKVPTKLSVSSDSTVTLTVLHHAASYVYPVVAGPGWEGGFHTYSIVMPPPKEVQEELEPSEVEYVEGNVLVRGALIGAPVIRSPAPLSGLKPEVTRPFRFTDCSYKGDPTPETFRLAKWDCHHNLDGDPVKFATLVNGHFHYEYDKKVWLNADEWGCHHWGKAAKVDCWRYDKTLYQPKGPIVPVGYFRLPPGAWSYILPTCDITGGILDATPPGVDEFPYSWPIYKHSFGWRFLKTAKEQKCEFDSRLPEVHTTGGDIYPFR
jgi:sugar lactone lactonase YvrE